MGLIGVFKRGGKETKTLSFSLHREEMSHEGTSRWQPSVNQEGGPYVVALISHVQPPEL